MLYIVKLFADCFKLSSFMHTEGQGIKGVTHCLLPECSRHTWPFENYCGKAHAEEGKRRGLMRKLNHCACSLHMTLFSMRPLPTTAPLLREDPTKPKDSTLCIIPGCPRKKYVESSGTVHPYCGKTCAERGKREGIVGKCTLL